jgi:F420-non-reducing hydrogenase iron-sulfur subunit
LLRQFGIDEERCRFDYVSAGEGEKFVNVVTEMVNTLKRLGPLSLGRIP